MTKNHYEMMKRAARHDAGKDEFGVGLKRIGEYVVTYSAYSGYEARKSPVILAQPDFYRYIHACRRLAQCNPGTSAQQLADSKAFLEVYKK